jgi:hypothetical protein
MAAGTVTGGLNASARAVVVCLIVCRRATRISARPSGSDGTGWRDEDDERGPSAWREVRIEVMDLAKPVCQSLPA